MCHPAQLLRSDDHVYLVEQESENDGIGSWSEVPYPRAVTPLSYS